LTEIENLLQALINKGYLLVSNAQAAKSVLDSAFSNDAALEERTKAQGDEAAQEQMKTGARAMIKQDKAKGAKRDLLVDRAILQDAINQEQVDELIIRDTKKEVTAVSHAAAAALADSGLIEKRHIRKVADLIENIADKKLD